jgi:hemerythrin-like domain-containing protein
MMCTELIAQDHAVLRRWLDILDRMVQIMEEGERIEIPDIRTVLKFLRLFGDQCHQAMEEKILFPVMLRAAPQKNIIQQMILDYGEERELIAAIEETLNPKHGIGFVRNSRRLIQLLRNHLEMEDAVFFKNAERLLSKEEDEAIVTQFRTNRTETDPPAPFARLERKYAPKSRGTAVERNRSAHA